MRARMALIDSRIDFNIYEISLKDKPKEMLMISPKGTVPVIKIGDDVIDESVDIMIWAYLNGVSSHFSNIDSISVQEGLDLIKKNDNQFKLSLDQYKYFTQYPDKKIDELREACLFFIEILDKRLNKNEYLLSNEIKFADIAIAPFIRQFANIDMNYFLTLKFSRVQSWLYNILNSDIFLRAMIKPR